MSETSPELWSDLDGTAVVKLSKLNPRNWLKYPLGAIAGYEDFVRGVGKAGVRMGGIVSIRPDILPRRLVTRRSMRQHGYDQLFPRSDQVILAGSEAEKARHLIERSREAPVCMIDDNPQHIGEALVTAMLAKPGRYPILLGAVDNPQNEHRYSRFSGHVDWVNAWGPDKEKIRVERFMPEGMLGKLDMPGMHVGIGAAALHFVQLPPYSAEAGQAFGGMMLQMAAP
ncbi:MAG TPA: hypothetical protein VIR03_02920 [Candidatus Saccharimonadales bacterium]